ncbi:hypothetical protein [Zavarzinella formosa]|uniref:hypothetical protein n=1 Tax=Zavarzinella formosa TaxID=360055 RepID=UPI0002E3A7F9|nr:hypothetical protein [Zavarzinella formosa]
MSQNAFSESNESGAAYRAGINAALQALASTNSGGSAPPTPYAQQMWVDTDTPSSTVWTLNMYDGTDWIPLCYIDSTNNVLLPFIGGGTATLASATTVDLGATPQSAITISGVTDVSGFGSAMKPGQSKIVIASGAWKLKYNATSLKIPGSADYTMAAGDKTIVTCVSAGNYDVMIFPKSGQSVAVGANKVTCFQITDSTDITLSAAPTQSNIGATTAIVIPTKGLIRLLFSGETITTGTPEQLILGIRIGSTNYWPTDSAYAYMLSSYAAGTTYTSQSWGTIGTGSSSPTGRHEVIMDIEALGIPGGPQTVQAIAAYYTGVGTTVIKGTAVTSRFYITIENHA